MCGMILAISIKASKCVDLNRENDGTLACKVLQGCCFLRHPFLLVYRGSGRSSGERYRMDERSGKSGIILTAGEPAAFFYLFPGENGILYRSLKGRKAR